MVSERLGGLPITTQPAEVEPGLHSACLFPKPTLFSTSLDFCILRKVPERFSLANLEVIDAEKSFKRLLISELVTLLKTPQSGLNCPRRLD